MDGGARGGAGGRAGQRRWPASRPLSGGDINEAYEVTLRRRAALFVKTNAAFARGDMFAAEARGLAWLGEAGCAARPGGVVAVGGRNDVAVSGAGDDRAGAAGARLRRAAGPWAGGAAPSRRGRVRPGPRQLRRPAAAGEHVRGRRWPEFYRARRLAAQLSRAVDGGLASRRMRRGFERLFADAGRAVSGRPSRRRGCTATCGAATCSCDERGRAVPDRPGGLRRPPRDRPRDDAPVRGLRRARVRGLRRGVAARPRPRRAACRCTSSIR